jgi:hypothetical protein
LIVCAGANSSGQCNAPAAPAGVTEVEVAAGTAHYLARRSDGSVVAWGDASSGKCSVPVLPAGLVYVQIAGGGEHSLALRSDGSVVAWGRNDYGQCNVPAFQPGLTCVEVAAGTFHSIARLSDGSVVAWGSNWYGETAVLPLPAPLTYVEIAGGYGATMARRSDGSVVAWGFYSFNLIVPPLPPGVSYVEIAAGDAHRAARRSDGSVVVWGSNINGQWNVPPLPAGLAYSRIAAKGNRTIALRTDGVIVNWGNSLPGFVTGPPPAGFVYVDLSAGGYACLAAYGVAGSSVAVGSGCGGAGTPAFAVSPPRLGQSVSLSLVQATPGAAGYVYYALVPAAPLLLASGCTVEIDLGTATVLVPVATDSSGAWSSVHGVPPDPVLAGLQLALQVALAPTQGPLGLDLSNGSVVTVGY